MCPPLSEPEAVPAEVAGTATVVFVVASGVPLSPKVAVLGADSELDIVPSGVEVLSRLYG